MSQLLDGRLGVENLQLAIYKNVVEHINEYIAAEETYAQTTIDTVLQSLDGDMRDVGTVTVERFETRNIHYGHRPSMIEAPIDDYPSAAVMVQNIVPGLSAMDYGHQLSHKVAIETIVKSGPYREDQRDSDMLGEDIVGRRIRRTAEAFFKLMNDYNAPGGLFLPSDLPPSITFGDIFIRQEDGASGTGHRWYWQGARLDWSYAKQTTFGIDQ